MKRLFEEALEVALAMVALAMVALAMVARVCCLSTGDRNRESGRGRGE